MIERIERLKRLFEQKRKARKNNASQETLDIIQKEIAIETRVYLSGMAPRTLRLIKYKEDR